MQSTWSTPTIFNQYNEDPSQISWSTTDNFSPIRTSNGRTVSLSAPLEHISRDPRNDITQKTWFLSSTGFTFINLPSIVSGVRFRFSVDRGGRVFDDTIQLTLNGELIGDNKCSLTVNPIQIYEGTADYWGVDDLTSIVQDSTFGIVIRMKSHPHWPHKTTPILRGVEVQVY